MFDISTLEFAWLQSFVKKQKYVNLGPKMPYLDIFELEISKTIVIFEITTLELVYLQNFLKK